MRGLALGLGMPPPARPGQAATVHDPVFLAGPTNAFSVAEDLTAVGDFYAYDLDYGIFEDGAIVTEDGIPIHDEDQDLTYSIVGGADQALFALTPSVTDNSVCSLSFLAAPNFEAPTDANTDNVYVVIVRVTDGEGRYRDQTISVTVTNVVEMDADAAAFFAANGITDPTIQSAVDAFIIAIKAANLWTNAKAFYLIVGGTAATHKWNARDPRDLDAAYRLTFGGTWTHSALGMKGTGGPLDHHADTKFLANALPSNAGAFGVYITENDSGGYCEIGANNAGGMEATIYSRYSGTTFMNFGTASYALSAGSSDSRGLWTCGRVDGSTSKAWKNSTEISSSNHAVTLPANEFYLGARNNNGTPVNRSPVRIAFAFITADAWDTTKQTAIYNAVQTLETALSRNV